MPTRRELPWAVQQVPNDAGTSGGTYAAHVANQLKRLLAAGCVLETDIGEFATHTRFAKRQEVTLLSTETSVLVKAMQAEGVSRLVVMTGIGAGDSAGHGGFGFDHLILPLLLRHVYADKNRQEAAIRQSGLDWTLVRPSVLNDKPGKGVLGRWKT